MKKTVLLFIIPVLLAGSLFLGSCASSGSGSVPQAQPAAPASVPDGTADSGHDGGEEDPPQGADAAEVILNGMRDLRDSIDVSRFGVTVDETEPIFRRIKNNEPDLFYVDLTYSYYADPGTNTVTEFIPQYTVSDPARVAEMREEYENEIVRICALCDPAWSDVEKALFFHDYIATEFEYDTTLRVADAYNFLKDGRGVCQAYTMLYIALLGRAGLTVDSVSSEEMDHTWNRVLIDGEWYHVDVTWDDPSPDRPGTVFHKYFLVSDAAISSESRTDRQHCAWEGYANPDAVCSDVSLDGALWSDVTSPFVRLGGSWYYVGTDPETGEYAIMKTDDLATAFPVRPFPDKWSAGSDTSYWAGNYSGLIGYENVLIFNTPRQIVSYDPESGAESVLFTLPDGSDDIYGIVTKDGSLIYSTAASPNEEERAADPLALSDLFPGP